MMRFKQFISERTRSRRAFIKPAREVEPLVISKIQKGQSSDDHKQHPMDIDRAQRINNFINNTLGTIGVNPSKITSISTYDTSGRGAAKSARKKLGIEGAGRHAEDVAISVGMGKQQNHYLLDFKLGPRGTGFNGYSKSTSQIYGLPKQLPQTLERGESKAPVSKMMADHFNSQSHEQKQNIVKGLLNIPDKVPSNVRRLQIQDSTQGTKIFDSDDVWKHFQTKFKPTSYRAEMSGTTHKIIAKNDNGEELHIASVSPKHERSTSNFLNYNVKHYLTQNLESRGLSPLAHLVH